MPLVDKHDVGVRQAHLNAFEFEAINLEAPVPTRDAADIEALVHSVELVIYVLPPQRLSRVSRSSSPETT